MTVKQINGIISNITLCTDTFARLSEKEKEAVAVAQRQGHFVRCFQEISSSQKIFDMLDLFYANKHMYEKLRKKKHLIRKNEL